MNIPNRAPVPAVVPGMPAALPTSLVAVMGKGQTAAHGAGNTHGQIAGLAGGTIGCLKCAQPGIMGPQLGDIKTTWPLWMKIGLGVLGLGIVGGVIYLTR